jgi:hypothetical protein
MAPVMFKIMWDFLIVSLRNSHHVNECEWQHNLDALTCIVHLESTRLTSSFQIWLEGRGEDTDRSTYANAISTQRIT